MDYPSTLQYREYAYYSINCSIRMSSKKLLNFCTIFDGKAKSARTQMNNIRKNVCATTLSDVGMRSPYKERIHRVWCAVYFSVKSLYPQRGHTQKRRVRRVSCRQSEAVHMRMRIYPHALRSHRKHSNAFCAFTAASSSTHCCAPITSRSYNPPRPAHPLTLPFYMIITFFVPNPPSI